MKNLGLTNTNRSRNEFRFQPKRSIPQFPTFSLTVLSGLLSLSLAALQGANTPGQEEFEHFKSTFDTFTTIAGRGLEDRGIHWKMFMEEADALDAELSRPHITMADEAGNFYIADKENHAIRVVDDDGIIRTVAGTNRPGNGPDGSRKGTTVDLNEPNGLYTFANGLTFILDTGRGVRVFGQS